MLGRQNRQTSFSDIEAWFDTESIVHSDSIYGLLGTWGGQLVKDDDFAEIFSFTGRPSVSPALLSKVLLLMYHDDVSDREAEKRATFDLRWKVTLQTPLQKTGFDYTALCRFRARLVVNKKQKMIFERFVQLAKDANIIKDDSLQIIDSSSILGAGAVKDTYMLIKTAIQKLLKISHKESSSLRKKLKDLPLQLDYKKKGKEDINWDDPEARQQLLQKLVDDSHTLLKAVLNSELTEKEQSAIEILASVTEQEIESTPDGKVTLRDGVAKDRIISVEDPEMRHGHKTSSGKFDGHKGQLMMDEATEIITNIEVTPGNQADGEALGDMVKTATAKPGIVMGDTAYGTLAAREAAEEQEVVPVAPLPMGNTASTDKFSKYDFRIDWETKTCYCPSGQSTTKTYTNKKSGVATAFVFPNSQCSVCSMRGQCTAEGKGRLVSLHIEEQKRRDIIEQTQTPEFKAMYRNRSKIERKVAHVMRRGMRKSRYMGKQKTLTQLAFRAAGVNIKRIFKVAKGEVSSFDRLTKILEA